MTLKEKNERQKKYRLLNNNLHTKKYEKTKKGFLVRTYRNMKSRVEGIQYLKSHLYEGKNLLDKNLFYEWSINNNDFNVLFDAWTFNNYNRKMSPSIDRIDSKLGYNLENMRWITHSENSRLGAINRKK